MLHTMLRTKNALFAFAVVVLFFLPMCTSAHYCVECAFENPASLIYMSDEQSVYVGTTLGNTSHLLAYSEYDAFACGYGALAVRTGGHVPDKFVGSVVSGAADTTAWSYIGAKRLGSIGVGLALNKETGASTEWTIDTGIVLDWQRFTVGPAIRRLSFGSEGLVGPRDIVSGVGLHISDSLSLELDAVSAPNPAYRLSVAVGLGSVSARLYAMGERNASMDPGVEIGLRSGTFTVRLGYQFDQQSSSQTARLGVGYSL